MISNLKKTVSQLFLAVFSACLAACAHDRPAAPSEIADKIFFNGKIVTMDDEFSIVSALAVKDGRVAAVGNDETIRAMSGARTERIDLAGRMMLPGLIDSHMHPNQAAVSEIDHSIPDMASIDDVLAYVRARAAVLPDGEWIWVRTVHPDRLKERRYPTRAELDAAAPNHPVGYAAYIYFPKASFNSAALALMGVDKDFVADNPDDIERDPVSGEPTGLIRHHTRYAPDAGSVDETTDLQKASLFREMMTIYNSTGLTTISDRKATREWMDVYEQLDSDSALTVRLSMMGELNTSKDRQISKIQQDIRALADRAEGLNSPNLQLIGVKTFLDGGITSGTAYLLEPWGESDLYAIEDADYRGNLNLSGERLEQIIEATARAGLQYTGHTVGDGAVTELVRAYKAVSKRAPLRQTRPSLTHANFMTPDVIETMSDVGIVADIQPAWFYLDGAMMVEQLGKDRMRYFQPLNTLFGKGVMIGGGSDHWHRLDPDTAVNPFNPFLSMWITMARTPRFFNEQTLFPEEALTRREALRMYTTNNAFLLFRENEIGSLEAGKFADLIVVDRDVLECSLEDFRNTRVVQTYLNGDLVYTLSE
ncbi:amidohydrolase [Hyphococcus sp.]|uniref:amidohydrolase n=1 Tax=Hyphococcus sp. TaxID=2038636 RepID=UPI003CCB941C